MHGGPSFVQAITLKQTNYRWSIGNRVEKFALVRNRVGYASKMPHCSTISEFAVRSRDGYVVVRGSIWREEQVIVKKSIKKDIKCELATNALVRGILCAKKAVTF